MWNASSTTTPRRSMTALDAEFDDLEPPDGVSSDDLIDDARWEIKDALDLGRSIAGCED
jgi:hypothetical protein